MFMPTMTSVYYNAIMFPMIFMGITAYVLSENKQRELLASLFVSEFFILLHCVSLQISIFM